ncbi:MAG TPA: DUF202 domain-containing protein [Candidatus Lustribacter sp.]|nr:DUF202 domain-containing protein [Candidatus Lustribacter sp.]
MSIPGRHALQPERTALAWSRTAVIANLTLVPLLLVNLQIGVWPLVVTGALVLIAASLVTLRLRHRYVQLRDDTTGYSPFGAIARLAAVVGATAATGVVTGVVMAVRAGTFGRT